MRIDEYAIRLQNVARSIQRLQGWVDRRRNSILKSDLEQFIAVSNDLHAALDQIRAAQREMDEREEAILTRQRGLREGRVLYHFAVLNEFTERWFSNLDSDQIAETLRDSAAIAMSTLDLRSALNAMITTMEPLVPHDVALVVLVDEGIGYVATAAGPLLKTDLDIAPALRLFEFEIDEVTSLYEMSRTHLPDLKSYWQAHEAFRSVPALNLMHSYLGAPILTRGELQGFMLLFSREPGLYQHRHQSFVQVFASHAASAIQNNRAHEQSQALNAIHQHQEMARDLHDAITQTVFSANMITETLPRTWKEMPEPLQQQLAYIHLLTRGALAELRTLLLELRPEQLAHINLSSQIRQLIDAFKARKYMEVTLDLSDGERLPARVRIAFYRIAQEALRMIAHYSQANQLYIRLDAHESRVCLQIQDNDPHSLLADDSLMRDNRASDGLRLMRHYAAGIQAELQLTETPHQGTHIQVDWQEPDDAAPLSSGRLY
ncbi:MAG: histidine kinase [Anaerolineae bacterium]